MFLLIALLIVLIFLWDYISKRRTYELTEKIPGPTPVPLIGIWKIFTIRSLKDIEDQLWHHYYKYGNFLRIFVFNRFVVVIARPDLVESILGSTKHIKKSYLYNLFSVWLGQGLLLSSGKYWHGRRKILTPAFHFKILETFIDVFDYQSRILVEIMRAHSNSGRGFDVHPYIARMTLDILCEAAMGVKLNAQHDPDCEYVKAVCETTEILMGRISYHYLFFDPIFKLLAPNQKKRQDAGIKVLHEFTERVIQERSDHLKKIVVDKEGKNADDDELGIKTRTILLDILLQSTIDGKPLSNLDIQEEVDNFLFAGHDTTTMALSFMLHIISRHPHVQRKMVAEIREIFGENKEEPLTYTKLQELKYIECVIKETLRLYPSVPVIGRELVEDTIVDGITIPAGAQIIIPMFVMMKDPEIFPNPEVFDPDRHIMNDTKMKMNPYAYIPFSAGPRNCIGQKFAMMQMKSVLCNVLRNFELLPLGEDPKLVITVVLSSENGMNIGIKERQS